MNNPNTAILLVSCPDRKGIVAGVANFLYRYHANILHADEHRDNERNIFFLRTEWSLEGFTLPMEEFGKNFSPLAGEFQMDWRVAESTNNQKTAIFVSKEDHCLADLLYRYKSGELACEIAFVFSNYSSSKSLADFYNVPFFEIPVTAENKIKSEKEIQQLLKKNEVDFVILARYMQILSKEFLDEFGKPVINIHHSFLPAFVGAKPYHQAYERGVKLIGATSHYVTEVLDNGPIIDQDVMRVSHRDSVQTMVQKGRDLEKIVLSRAVRLHCENKILKYENKTVVFD